MGLEKVAMFTFKQITVHLFTNLPFISVTSYSSHLLFHANNEWITFSRLDRTISVMGLFFWCWRSTSICIWAISFACANAIRASACSRAWQAKKSASVTGSGSLCRGKVSSEVEGRVDGGEGLSCSGWKHYSLWVYHQYIYITNSPVRLGMMQKQIPKSLYLVERASFSNLFYFFTNLIHLVFFTILAYLSLHVLDQSVHHQEDQMLHYTSSFWGRSLGRWSVVCGRWC